MEYKNTKTYFKLNVILFKLPPCKTDFPVLRTCPLILGPIVGVKFIINLRTLLLQRARRGEPGRNGSGAFDSLALWPRPAGREEETVSSMVLWAKPPSPPVKKCGTCVLLIDLSLSLGFGS